MQYKMAVLNPIILYTTLLLVSLVVASLVTIEAIPIQVESQWIVDAKKSINDSLSTIKSYGVENEKIMNITNEAFDSFTKLVENDLSKIIKQMDNIKSEKILILITQLNKWAEGLDKVNNPDVIEKTLDTAIAKFYKTIDFTSKNIVHFLEDFNDESTEFSNIVDQLKSLLVSSVAELVKYASSVKDQVSKMSQSK